MHKPQFENDYFYHIYNRGVEKRNIFGDEFDYFRFIHNLFEFNDVAPAGKFSSPRLSEVEPPKVKNRDMLVKIHCFCLMPNHFHLLLEQKKIGGIVQFMKKLGTGYAMYFNEKYRRVGPLFQGRFKAILIEDESYLLHLSRYIHLNPVELIAPQWKEGGVEDWTKIHSYLESYRWSSYLDYIGKKNFPSVISSEFIHQLLTPDNQSPFTQYRKFVYEGTMPDTGLLEGLTFE